MWSVMLSAMIVTLPVAEGPPMEDSVPSFSSDTKPILNMPLGSPPVAVTITVPPAPAVMFPLIKPTPTLLPQKPLGALPPVPRAVIVPLVVEIVP